MTAKRLIQGSYSEQRYLHSDEIFRKERNWNIHLPSEREFKNGYCIITDKDNTAYSVDELVELLNEFQKENEQLKQEYQKLKHRHSLLHDVCLDAECERDSLKKDVNSLEKENEQLKERNKKRLQRLKNQRKELEKQQEAIWGYKGDIKQLEKENERLRKGIDLLQEENDDLNKFFLHNCKTLDYLKWKKEEVE